MTRLMVLLTLLVGMTTTEASAGVEACAGQWEMRTWSSPLPLVGAPEELPLPEPGGPASPSQGFTMYNNAAPCAFGASVYLSGHIAGFRGFATGSGTTYLAGRWRAFDFAWFGTTLEMWGDVHGTLHNQLVVCCGTYIYFTGTIEAVDLD